MTDDRYTGVVVYSTGVITEFSRAQSKPSELLDETNQTMFHSNVSVSLVFFKEEKKLVEKELDARNRPTGLLDGDCASPYWHKLLVDAVAAQLFWGFCLCSSFYGRPLLISLVELNAAAGGETCTKITIPRDANLLTSALHIHPITALNYRFFFNIRFYSVYLFELSQRIDFFVNFWNNFIPNSIQHEADVLPSAHVPFSSTWVTKGQQM